MKIRALVGFAGVISMLAGQVMECDNDEVLKDLLSAGYVEAVADTPPAVVPPTVDTPPPAAADEQKEQQPDPEDGEPEPNQAAEEPEPEPEQEKEVKPDDGKRNKAGGSR